MRNRILVGTGQNIINKAVSSFENYNVVGIVESREDLLSKCEEFSPEILLVGEGLYGIEPLVKPLLEISRLFPNIRIVYLAGHVDLRDEARVNALALLVMAGIYDIVLEKKMTAQMLKSILDNPKTETSAQYIINASNKFEVDKEENAVEFIIPEDNIETEDDKIRKNLFVISSIKPGTGKSFLSVNIASAIAQYGVDTKGGKKPRVGLIEADLQNLSLGTLLQIEDDSKNLKTVMNKISTIVTESGDYIGNNPREIEEVNNYIKSCFIPYCRIKNLEALVGSQLTMQELEEISSYYYIYLIDAIAEHFDVIIVDSNSALTHVTTVPLLYMAKNCYYILNLDFNNVRNNMKYKDVLSEMGILNKVKYVLNEDIVNEIENPETGTNIEKLIFDSNHLEDSEFKLEAKIPIIPKTVFLNSLYEGTPIVLENRDVTEKAKFEILKVANQIYPIKNFSKIEKDFNDKANKKKGFFR